MKNHSMNPRDPDQFRTFVAICLLLLGAPVTSWAQPISQPSLDAPYADGRLVIKLQNRIEAQERVRIEADLHAALLRRLPITGAEVWNISGISVEEAVARYQHHPSVEYVEPDYIVFGLNTPNDPNLLIQWGLRNTGQTGGTPDADIDGPEAWDLETGTDVVIAVVDSGVDYQHPDLIANIWTHPGEIPANGIDDDGNGFVDDVHGYDFRNDDGDPMDDRFHGTHVAGISAASGNNGLGIAGVNWSAKIMVLKFLGDDNLGLSSDAAAAIEYAMMMGARLSNHSWGGCSFSQLLLDVIEQARAAGHLLVAGAGNGNCPPLDGGDDIDQIPFYPASYSLDNIVTVAATDHNDDKPGFSNFGANSVDLGAPGVDIFSTFLPFVDFDGTYVCSDTDGDRYGFCTGTSMATPFVTGVAALLWAAHPELGYLDIRNLILSTVDPVPALQGITVTGGRLNAFNALAAADMNQPPVAVDDFYKMAPDTFLEIFFSTLLLNDSDPDEGPEPLRVVDCPGPLPSGTLCGVSPSGCCFRPAPGFVGEIVLPYTISDGLDEATADIFITVGTEIFSDGFEAFSLAAWDSQTTSGNGTLAVSGQHPMVGSAHLAASVFGAGSDKAFVEDLSPDAETFYRARFHFNPSQARMRNGNLHRIFLARDDSPSANVAMMQIRRNGIQRQVRARARRNDLTWANTVWVSISGPTQIELVWWNDQGAGGGLSLAVDGAVADTVKGLDNDQFQIDRVSLGILSGVDAGTHGSFYFDQFESFSD